MDTKSELTQKFDLFYELLRTGFKLRYNDSVLGVLWVIMRPLINFIVLYFVFSHLRALDSVQFEIYLFTGVILYSYFSESVLTGAGSLIGMAHIILKVKFPKQIAIISVQGLAIINLIINLCILFVFAVVLRVEATLASTLYLLFVIFVMTVITYALSLFTSVLSVRFRDIKNLIEVFLQIGFYLSPIFYPITIIPERYRDFIQYNPITIFIETSRSAIIYGRIENLQLILALGLFGVLLALLGRIVFNRLVKKVAEYY